MGHWLFSLYRHVHRGEYYLCAYEFPLLRDIVEQWAARLAGHGRFGSRRLENAAWAERLVAYDLFPKPNRESLRACMLNAIELQLELRREIARLDVAWRTDTQAIAKISRSIRAL